MMSKQQWIRNDIDENLNGILHGDDDRDVLAKKELMKYLKICDNLLSYRRSFYHFSKLTYDTIDEESIMINSKAQTMTYRYKFRKNKNNNNSNGKRNISHQQHCPAEVDKKNTIAKNVPCLSIFTALMDTLSSYTCYAVFPSPRLTLSLHMATQLLVEDFSILSSTRYIEKKDDDNEIDNEIDNGQGTVIEIDIINHITKLGKSVAFTRTEFVHVRTCQLLAISSHVMYIMPANAAIGRGLQPELQSKGGKKTQQNHETFVSRHDGYRIDDDDIIDGRSMQQVILDGLKFAHDDGQRRNYDRQETEQREGGQQKQQNRLTGRAAAAAAATGDEKEEEDIATFHVAYGHTNGVKLLHGGCHTMIMELVGENFVRQKFQQQQHQQNSEQFAKHQGKKESSGSGADKVTLQSIQVDFLSAVPCHTTVTISCIVLGYSSSTPTFSDNPPSFFSFDESSATSMKKYNTVNKRVVVVRVQIKLPDGRIASDGTLQFRVAIPEEKNDGTEHEVHMSTAENQLPGNPCRTILKAKL